MYFSCLFFIAHEALPPRISGLSRELLQHYFWRGIELFIHFHIPFLSFKISPAGFMISLEYSIVYLQRNPSPSRARDKPIGICFVTWGDFFQYCFSLSEEEKGAVFCLSSDNFTTKFTNFYYLIKMKYPSFLHLPKFFLTIQYL